MLLIISSLPVLLRVYRALLVFKFRAYSLSDVKSLPNASPAISEAQNSFWFIPLKRSPGIFSKIYSRRWNSVSLNRSRNLLFIYGTCYKSKQLPHLIPNSWHLHLLHNYVMGFLIVHFSCKYLLNSLLIFSSFLFRRSSCLISLHN